MTTFNRDAFLAPCDVIDFRDPAVRELAAQLTGGARDLAAIEALFTWVRDSIAHTGDAGHGKLTLRASEVLREGTGLCYAKSHLLVALLRASGIPAGFCYQRLSLDEQAPTFVLHGLAAVLMPDETFLRIDARGNKPGVDAQFSSGREALAFETHVNGETDYPGVFARPLPEVVAALARGGHWDPVSTALPDITPARWPRADAGWHKPTAS